MQSHERRLLRDFSKLCNDRHKKRSDVQKRSQKRAREVSWEQLVSEIMQEKGCSRTQARLSIVRGMKVIVDDLCESIWASDPTIRRRYLDILTTRKVAMQQEANQITSHQDGPVVPTCASCGPDQIDESGYVITRLDAMTILKGEDKVQYLQILSSLSDKTSRYFLCRAEVCHREGNYYGLNLSWASTAQDGGWRWACPICGTWFRPGSKGLGSQVAATHVFHTAQGALLSKWPDSMSEATIMALLETREIPHASYDGLSDADCLRKICSIVQRHAVPVQWQQLQLTDRARVAIDEMNKTKKRKTCPFRYDHLLQGFSGTFIKVTPDTEIMSIQQVKDLLSLFDKHIKLVAAL